MRGGSTGQLTTALDKPGTLTSRQLWWQALRRATTHEQTGPVADTVRHGALAASEELTQSLINGCSFCGQFMQVGINRRPLCLHAARHVRDACLQFCRNKVQRLSQVLKQLINNGMDLVQPCMLPAPAWLLAHDPSFAALSLAHRTAAVQGAGSTGAGAWTVRADGAGAVGAGNGCWRGRLWDSAVASSVMVLPAEGLGP